ncbi:hypothetical protein [uncultured Desulfuromusa sp.]|nr:hypothetical protein [uncultured Desulfuromusa sp.]
MIHCSLAFTSSGEGVRAATTEKARTIISKKGHKTRIFAEGENLPVG